MVSSQTAAPPPPLHAYNLINLFYVLHVVWCSSACCFQIYQRSALLLLSLIYTCRKVTTRSSDVAEKMCGAGHGSKQRKAQFPFDIVTSRRTLARAGLQGLVSDTSYVLCNPWPKNLF